VRYKLYKTMPTAAQPAVEANTGAPPAGSGDGKRGSIEAYIISAKVLGKGQHCQVVRGTLKDDEGQGVAIRRVNKAVASATDMPFYVKSMSEYSSANARVRL